MGQWSLEGGEVRRNEVKDERVGGVDSLGSAELVKFPGHLGKAFREIHALL